MSRIRSAFDAKREEYIGTYGEQARESDPEDRAFHKILESEQAQIEELKNALTAAESDWYVARAFKQRVPIPPGSEEYWEDEGGGIFYFRLKPAPLREFKDAVIRAERETWKHRLEWMAFIFAVLFGVVTAVSVFYNIFSTQRKLNAIQGRLNDTQSVLADTQAKLYDKQRKLTDLTEQVRRREVSAGKRGVIPRTR